MTRKWDIIDFEPGHIIFLGAQPEQGFVFLGNWEQLLGVTLLLDEEPAVILGICPVWQGVYDVVMLPGELFYSHPATCWRHIRHWLSGIQEHLDWHRLQATINMNFPRHATFAKRFGFREEGILQQYGPKRETMGMYSIVKET